MNRLNYQIKSLIATSLIAFILCIITSCFAWWNSQLDKRIAIMQNDLELINEELIETQENLQIEIDKYIGLSEDLEVANNTIADLKSEEYELIYLGEFKLTHYCTEKENHICGTGDGITATGTNVSAGRTIAVDPTIIPYGSEVYIEGYGWRIAEDCGGAIIGKHIDIAVGTHDEALSMGTTSGGVWILVKNS